MKVTSKAVIALAILASLLSFIKFNHCRNAGWSSPDMYTHACYSDITALYDQRNIADHSWPYSHGTNSLEYPPLTGVVTWASSYLVFNSSDSLIYFDVSALLLALLFIAVVIFIWRMKPEFWYLLPLSPAVIASLYINWDLWAVISAVVAIYLFDRGKYEWSALALGISISTKFFPVILILPIAAIFIRKSQRRDLFRYLTFSALTWLLINAPFAIFNGSGWWHFFDVNSKRAADWGSIWFFLDRIGINVSTINLLAILLLISGSAFYFTYLLGARQLPTLASSAFIALSIFTIASKVYSPQYVLWLTPLAILALIDKRDRVAFWIWQGAEVVYHFAIWQHLAAQEGSHFGLSEPSYTFLLALRIIALAYFCATLMRKSPASYPPQSSEFLSSATGGYA